MSPAGMEKAMSPAALEAGRSLLVPKRCQQMRTPGLEPGSQVWEACMMPLRYATDGILTFVPLQKQTRASGTCQGLLHPPPLLPPPHPPPPLCLLSLSLSLLGVLDGGAARPVAVLWRLRW